MRARDFLTELWTKPYPLESRAIGAADREYNFTTVDERRGRIVFDSRLDTDAGGTHLLFVVVHFYIDNEFHDTGKGDAIKIFSTVVTACRDYITKYKPPIIVFESESSKKRQLYLKIAQESNNYEIYPDWYKDRELGQEIDNASVNGVREEMIVLRLKNYDPAKTRAYVEGVVTAREPENPSVERDDVNIDYHWHRGNLVVTARSLKNKTLGSVVFINYGTKEQPKFKGESLFVDERYRRQGIATMMYDFAKQVLGKIYPSDAQTPQGKKFWQGKEVWEASLNRPEGPAVFTKNQGDDLKEFAPNGFEYRRYKLWNGDGITRHFIDKFSTVEDAVEEVYALWDIEPETRLIHWFITNKNDVVVWDYDPQFYYDQMRMGKKIQFRKPPRKD